MVTVVGLAVWPVYFANSFPTRLSSVLTVCLSGTGMRRWLSPVSALVSTSELFCFGFDVTKKTVLNQYISNKKQ
jgi:hypothetical protein